MLLAEDSSPTVTAVKVVLATVVLGLAGYQAVLAAVVYGRLRSLGLARRVAARAHRLVGVTTTALMVAVGAVCLSAYGVGDAAGGRRQRRGACRRRQPAARPHRP